jgi:hypothetical protein
MKKQIYLLKHAYVPTWEYVGATSEKRLTDSLCKKWWVKRKQNTLLMKALRSSEDKSDWTITQLHDFSEDWQQLEAKYIREYDSFHNGLNSTASGAWEPTKRRISAMQNIKGKPVLCSNGITYISLSEAARQTGAFKTNISEVLSGNRKTAGGFTWSYA